MYLNIENLVKNDETIQAFIEDIDQKLSKGYDFKSITIDKWNNIYKKEIEELLNSKYELDNETKTRILNILKMLNSNLYDKLKEKDKLNKEISLDTLDNLLKMDGIDQDIFNEEISNDEIIENEKKINNCLIKYDYEVEKNSDQLMDIDMFALCLDKSNNFKNIIYYNNTEMTGIKYKILTNDLPYEDTLLISFPKLANDISTIKIFVSEFNNQKLSNLKDIRFNVMDKNNLRPIFHPYKLDNLNQNSVICMEFKKNDDEWSLQFTKEEFSDINEILKNFNLWGIKNKNFLYSQ